MKDSAILAIASDMISFESGPVRVHVSFYLPKPKSAPKRTIPHVKKPDIDKLMRAILDALKGVVWTDDSQVTSISATKDYAEGSAMPRADIRIEQIGVEAPRIENQLGLRSCGMGA